MTERVEELIAAMSLDERAAMTGGIDMWHAVGCERLGVRGLKVSDGPNGARGSYWAGTTSACAPCGTALASSWDTGLVRRVGVLLGEETRSKGADLLLAPTVNLHRSPLAGRNFECWSEDPHLTAELAVAYIDGVQSTGVGAAIKHLVANDSEFERHTISSEVDERTLRELYLVPFEAAVTRSGVMSVMAAYNRLNGTYCAEHPALVAALEEWGFDGFMISDWWGTQSTEATAATGVDLEMPGPATHLGAKLADAIRAGIIDETLLDAKLRRLLNVMERLGVLDEPEHRRDQSIDRPDHRELLREAARRSVVLLRNAPAGAAGQAALPLIPSTINSLAVIGPNADVQLVQGGGSAQVSPHHAITVLDGIRSRFGDSREVVYERGCDAYRNLPPLDHRWTENGFQIEYFANRDFTGEPVLVQHVDVPRFSWLGNPGPGVTGGTFSARVRAVVHPPAGVLDLSLIVGGQGRLSIDGTVVAEMWDHFEPGESFFGMGSAEVRAEVSGPAPFELMAEFVCFDGLAAGALLIGGLLRLADDAIDRAARLAAGADAAVVVVGLNQDWETEGADRVDWELPGQQVELIRAVAAVQPRTVVLVQAGGPVEMSWVDEVAAVAQIWYLGQETGDAVADLLSGDHSPSGHLPTTLPVRFEDHATVDDYPGADGQVHYREGVFIGYRSFDQRDVEPRFCFGHGLSYTTFSLEGLSVDPSRAAVSCKVRNNGPVAAHCVVQAYVRPPVAGVPRPPQELGGFVSTYLEPGATRNVDLALRDRAFQHWDPATGAWTETPGRYEIAVGWSSRDTQATVIVDRAG